MKKNLKAFFKVIKEGAESYLKEELPGPQQTALRNILANVAFAKAPWVHKEAS